MHMNEVVRMWCACVVSYVHDVCMCRERDDEVRGGEREVGGREGEREGVRHALRQSISDPPPPSPHPHIFLYLSMRGV